MKLRHDSSMKTSNYYKLTKTRFILSLLEISLTLIISTALAEIIQPAQAHNIPILDLGIEYDDIVDFPDFPFFPDLFRNFDHSFLDLPKIGNFDLR